jgi:hypothetical protein
MPPLSSELKETKPAEQDEKYVYILVESYMHVDMK